MAAPPTAGVPRGLARLRHRTRVRAPLPFLPRQRRRRCQWVVGPAIMRRTAIGRRPRLRSSQQRAVQRARRRLPPPSRHRPLHRPRRPYRLRLRGRPAPQHSRPTSLAGARGAPTARARLRARQLRLRAPAACQPRWRARLCPARATCLAELPVWSLAWGGRRWVRQRRRMPARMSRRPRPPS